MPTTCTPGVAGDHHSRSRYLPAFTALLAIAIATAGCGDNDSSAAVATTVWQTFAASLDRPVTEANPFDPDEIEVSAEFVAPGGTARRVLAFVARDFERTLVDGRERLTPLGDLGWRLRFTPDEPGSWQWRWRIRTPEGDDIGAWQDLEVGPADPDGKGFLRRSPRDARFLEHDDGSAWVAVGENLSWYGARGTYDYDQWIERLAAEGVTYIRLWMPSWATSLEVLRRNGDGSVALSTLGNYTERLDRAWQLDYVLDLAARHGIAVMLCIQNHGPFSLDNNSEWDDNPYNVANGGPLATPGEFFVDTEARALFRQRLRYLVARWGHATNLLAWELWNEVDLAESPSDEAVVDWHREMAAEIRTLDPYDHLISTSMAEALAVRPGLDAVWALDAIDFTQAHRYSFGGLRLDFTQIFPRIAARLQRFGKPLLFAEAGVDFRGPAETIANDPEGDGFHDLLWAGLFSGGFGSGMTWWWDNVIDPEDQYFHFGPLAELVDGVDFPGEGFVVESANAPGSDSRSARVFTLRGVDTVLVWVKNAQHQWYAPDPVPVAGVDVAVTGLAGETWRYRWLDTRGSGEVAAGTVQASGGSLTLAAPTFARDIALRLERVQVSRSRTTPRAMRN